MKLTYATDFDVTNLNNWSGLGHYYGVMLRTAGFEVSYLNNIRTPLHSLHMIKRYLMKRTVGTLYSPRYSVQVSKAYAQILQKRVAAESAIISPNTVILANLNSKNKRILYADATFELLVKLYPVYSNLSKKCMIEGYEVDRLAVQSCDLLIYSSQWAANSAINYYNADPEKVFVAPFGANLNKVPNYNEIKNIIRKRSTAKRINILFLGVDWIRKGGDIAIDVVNKLNQKGVDAVLHIVGTREKLTNYKESRIINHGFIEKNSLLGQEKLAHLFSMCHLLLLPTRADCTPVAFSEANAYGMPCITTNVGGNSCIVQNDVNGKVFEPINFTEKAVTYIQELVESDVQYNQLCFSAYDRYCTELNWGSTGKKIFKLISAL